MKTCVIFFFGFLCAVWPEYVAAERLCSISTDIEKTAHVVKNNHSGQRVWKWKIGRGAFTKVSVGRIVGTVLLLLLFAASAAGLIALLSTETPIAAIVLLSFATAFFLFLSVKMLMGGFKKKQRTKPLKPRTEPEEPNEEKLIGAFLLLLLLAVAIAFAVLTASAVNGISLLAFLGIAALCLLIILLLKSGFKRKQVTGGFPQRAPSKNLKNQ